jgi:N-acetylneuraminic acid mutarotase
MKQNICFLILIIVPNFLVGQYNTWTKKNDFIAGKRERAVAFSIGNYGYVSTGIDTAEILLKDLWQYDPNTDTWNQKADLPGPARRDAVAFSVNGKGYVGTGIDNASALVGNKLKDIWEYDPTLNTWIQKADFPGSGGNGIYFATAFSADNKGYVCGGKWGPNLYSSQLWEYKPSSDQWIQRANFPGGVRYQLSSFSIENQGYVGLGANQDIYKKDFLPLQSRVQPMDTNSGFYRK